jgi:hypothetical protein
VNRLPPRIVRRLVLAPLVFVLSLALLALSPLAVVLASLVDVIVRGGWRTVRLIAFGAWYVAFEVMGLIAMFGLWVASGFGLRLRSPGIQAAHYGFMRWWLRGIDGAAVRLFRMRIHIEDRPQPQPGPVLVFSRHAGPGNSLMLIGTLMLPYRRHPRIVMLAKLQWEPLFDIMLNRVPNRFIQHDPRKRDLFVTAIADLASGLGDQDAFVLFPEGHDFTHHLRLRAIAHLRKRGHDLEAERAERMSHVLPPKTGGLLAAIAAAPKADVVFVAHTVLEDVGSVGDLWSRIPFTTPIVSRYWRIPSEEVPRDPDQLKEWLFVWWARIDGWIQQRVAAQIGAVPSTQEPAIPAGPGSERSGT